MVSFKLVDFPHDETFPFFIQIGDQQGDFFMHTHSDFCELVVVVQGSALHVVEDVVYPIKQGDVFVISGDTAHGYKNAKDFRPCNIMFRDDFFISAGEDLLSCPGFQALFVLEPAAIKNEGFGARLKLRREDYPRIEELCKDMLGEFSAQSGGWVTKFKAQFLVLCTELSRLYEQSSGTQDTVFYPIAEALAYIERNYLSEISVNDLAKLSNYSQRQFLRLFKKSCGCTPTEYIRKLRIRNACRLLRSSPDPITSVATRCGYSDSNYFTRAFKAETGKTPREYRSAGSGSRKD